jgi:ParB/RepB/Spo0J family partition protein
MTKAIPAGALAATAPVLQFVKVSALRASKTNPRKSIDPAFIAELAASVRKDGVLTALLLRPLPWSARDVDAFEIVSGEQRYRAAKEAGILEVPALVRDLTDDQVMSIQLVENLKRRDLTALEEADGYNHLVKVGAKVERVAEEIGRSVEYVYDRLRLMSLVAEVRELLLSKRIELGHAIALAGIAPDDQRRAIREEGGGLWTSQRTMWIPGGEGMDRTRTDDNYKPVSVKELKLWIDDRVKFRVDAPVNLQLFPETVTAVQRATEEQVKIVHITHEHQVHPDAKDATGPRVYSAMSWQRADGKAKSKTCDHSALGVIDVGPMRGQSLMVCVDRKSCLVHFADVIRDRKKREKEVAESGTVGEDRHKLANAKEDTSRRKEQENHAAFLRALPAIRLAIAKQISSWPIANAQALILKFFDEELNIARKGVEKLCPQGKTLESWVRYVASAVALRDLVDETWSDRGAAFSAGDDVGVDVEKIIATQSAPRVEKCRVCECTETKPCRARKTPAGPMEACSWTEKPDKKTGLGLCSACAEKTGQKPPAKKK